MTPTVKVDLQNSHGNGWNITASILVKKGNLVSQQHAFGFIKDDKVAIHAIMDLLNSFSGNLAHHLTYQLRLTTIKNRTVFNKTDYSGIVKEVMAHKGLFIK